MSKLRAALDYQQKVNDAVKAVTDYFNAASYVDDLELMLSAQTQIIGQMELAKQQMIRKKNGDDPLCQSDEITLFLQVVREYLKLLKPFAELTDGIYFDDNKD